MRHPASQGSCSSCKPRLAIVLVLFSLFLPRPILAGTFIAFGPQLYKRDKTKPVIISTNFKILNPNTSYTLQIRNGALEWFKNVTSAVVTLLGKSVILKTSNNLSVQVNEPQGGAMTIQIMGVDNNPPQISASASPSPNAAGWNNTNVTVSFTCIRICPWSVMIL